MSQALSIILFDEVSNSQLSYVFTDVQILSGISSELVFTLKCQCIGDFETECENIDNLKDVTLSITGGFGNPSFPLYRFKSSVKMKPGSDILDITLTLVDRWQHFREIKQTGVFYYSNINAIYNELYKSTFRKVMNSGITPILNFNSTDVNKYPEHPIYMHYKETHWEFFQRVLHEHGLNYTWIVNNDGYDFVITDSNHSLTQYFKDNEYNQSLYNYNFDFKNTIASNASSIINIVYKPKRSGYFDNDDLSQIKEYLLDSKGQISDISRSHQFIQNIMYVHHPAYDPNNWLKSDYKFDDEKFNVSRHYKTRFNSVNQAQLDECVKREVNIIKSTKAEQMIASVKGEFLLSGCNLNLINRPKSLTSNTQIVRASIVTLKAADNMDITKGSRSSRLNYNVTTTFISQDIDVTYTPKMPEQPKIRSFSGVFPYVSQRDAGYDIITPDDIGNVPLIFPLTYEICPNGEKDIRYYAPRVMNNNYESAPYYPETELYVMFIDGNPNKPIIYGALANSATSDLSMSKHTNRFYHAYGQGSYFGYTSAARDNDNIGNTIMFQSRHTGGVSWIAQSNHKDPYNDGELAQDQLLATTATRTNLISGEFQEHQGFTDGLANHHKMVKPARAIEDEKLVKDEPIKQVAPPMAVFSTKQTCVLDSLDIKCSHNRKLKLRNVNLSLTPVFNVVADGGSKDNITIDYDFSCKQSCPTSKLEVIGKNARTGTVEKKDYQGGRAQFAVGAVLR